MTPVSPESFNKMYPWRKYLKQDKRTKDERDINDNDFIGIPNKYLEQFHAYKTNNGIIVDNTPIKKSFTDKIQDIIKDFSK